MEFTTAEVAGNDAGGVGRMVIHPIHIARAILRNMAVYPIAIEGLDPGITAEHARSCLGDADAVHDQPDRAGGLLRDAAQRKNIGRQYLGVGVAAVQLNGRPVLPQVIGPHGDMEIVGWSETAAEAPVSDGSEVFQFNASAVLRDEGRIHRGIAFLITAGGLDRAQFLALEGRHDHAVDRAAAPSPGNAVVIGVIDLEQGIGRLGKYLRHHARHAGAGGRRPGRRLPEIAGGPDVIFQNSVIHLGGNHR